MECNGSEKFYPECERSQMPDPIVRKEFCVKLHEIRQCSAECGFPGEGFEIVPYPDLNEYPK